MDAARLMRRSGVMCSLCGSTECEKSTSSRTGGFFAPGKAPHVTPPPAARSYGFAISAQAFLFSQGWLATPQLVLQALWQEVWHSPQPPLTALSQRLRVSRVFILFIVYTPF